MMPAGDSGVMRYLQAVMSWGRATAPEVGFGFDFLLFLVVASV